MRLSNGESKIEGQEIARYANRLTTDTMDSASNDAANDNPLRIKERKKT